MEGEGRRGRERKGKEGRDKKGRGLAVDYLSICSCGEREGRKGGREKVSRLCIISRGWTVVVYYCTAK